MPSSLRTTCTSPFFGTGVTLNEPACAPDSGSSSQRPALNFTSGSGAPPPPPIPNIAGKPAGSVAISNASHASRLGHRVESAAARRKEALRFEQSGV